MKYVVSAWARDNRPEKPEDFDEEKGETPEEGFRNNSGKKKIRAESPPYDDPKDAVDALADTLEGMTKKDRLLYHTIKIEDVEENGASEAAVPVPGS